jgi:outer membrane lipoprotein-sorting protein
MKRRTALMLGLALTATPLAALPIPGQAQGVQAAALSAQDQTDLARIEQYLNSIKTLKARFLQIAPNGQQSTGTAWLERPGRMRFQYDPPSPLLLVAGHGLFVYYDSQLRQTTNIPLSSTPLGILLSDHVSLSGNVTVTGIHRLPGQIQVTVVRTATPGEGSLTLIFNANPLALVAWVVTDAQRQETRVRLFDVQLGGTFDQDLFRFIDPNFFHNNNSG